MASAVLKAKQSSRSSSPTSSSALVVTLHSILSAATLGGFPRVIMERNAIQVLRQVLGKWVDFAAITDPAQLHFGNRGLRTGNPIRPQFNPFRRNACSALHHSRLRRQPGRPIHQQSSDGIPQFLQDLKTQLRFVHQTGERQIEDVRRAYGQRLHCRCARFLQ